MTAVNSSSQTYDDAGNLTRTSGIYGAKYTLVYDHHNRLIEVKDDPATTRLAAFVWDALGRRIGYTDDTNSTTTRYYYDGVNEVYEYNDSGDPLRYYVHGVSYIDERLAMVNCYETTSSSDDRPYYYVLDRMYNVRALVDRAGSIVERYCYDPYGKPLIRESLGRGDQNGQDTILGLGDATAFAATTATPPTMWDPRADMDDDGDIDATDVTLKNAKAANWPNPGSEPTVAQAFSDVGNRYMFQGVPHFAIDTSSSDTTVKFPLNHHRARFAEPVTGRWLTRDPLGYSPHQLAPLEFRRGADFLAIRHACKQSTKQLDQCTFLEDRSLYTLFGLAPQATLDSSGLCGCEPPRGGVYPAGGWVDCCNGIATPCVEPLGPSPLPGDELLQTCGLAHEMYHVYADGWRCCYGLSGMQWPNMPMGTPPAEESATECPAYNVSVNCLIIAIGECAAKYPNPNQQLTCDNLVQFQLRLVCDALRGNISSPNGTTLNCSNIHPYCAN